MNCCRETTKMGGPPGNRPAAPRDWCRGVPERYVAGTDTRGRQEGRPYPWSQQVIHEISGLGLARVQSSGVTFQDLPRFSLPRCFFSSTRFCIAASDILVGFLLGFCLRACCNNSMKRSRATSLLAAWLRVFWEMTRRIPFLLIRVAIPSRTSCFCSEVRLGELITSNPSVTRVLALLTC